MSALNVNIKPCTKDLLWFIWNLSTWKLLGMNTLNVITEEAAKGIWNFILNQFRRRLMTTSVLNVIIKQATKEFWNFTLNLTMSQSIRITIINAYTKQIARGIWRFILNQCVKGLRFWFLRAGPGCGKKFWGVSGMEHFYCIFVKSFFKNRKIFPHNAFGDWIKDRKPWFQPPSPRFTLIYLKVLFFGDKKRITFN